MSSLLEKFAGRVDLIYIDPPFATGADFSFNADVGEGEVEITKDQSVIEEKAYRDTWGRGVDSYLTMMEDRLRLMRDLLSHRGNLFVHCDEGVGHHLKLLLDDLFGSDACRADIIFKRRHGHS